MRRPSSVRVTAPDGYSWTVGPRWKAGDGVRLPSRWRRDRDRDHGDGDGIDWFGFADLDGPVVAIAAILAFAVVTLLAVFVVWPLLALTAELIVAVALLVAGVVGRLAFGRPWTIEALRDDGRAHTWQIRGYRPMRARVREIAVTLEAGRELPPPAAYTGER